MRWFELFADLERQFEAGLAAERGAEVAELTRAELAGVTLGDRMRAAQGRAVAVTLRHGARVEGELIDSGSTWLLLVAHGREHLLPLHAAVLVDGIDAQVAPPAGAVSSRLGLGHALRAVARDRSLVRVTVQAGTQVDGRVGAVGADHLEVAVARADSGRPSGALRTVTFAGLDLVSAL